MPVKLSTDEAYVLLPRRLALDLRDQQLAVGIYLLVARSYLVQQGPIPLSATDIETYDGSATLRRGAILRALERLCAEGWLLATRRRGHKATYLPTWGSVGGAVRPWNLDMPGLHRPRSVSAVRIPRVAIDVCLGRLIPHHRHEAIVERYVTRPPLALRDLGAYGLLWAGIGANTAALAQLGLADGTGPLAPPSWGMLLARISQRPLCDPDPTAPTLSVRGLQRAGIGGAPPAPLEPPALFFVPPDMIGGLIPAPIAHPIGAMIGSEGADYGGETAAPRAQMPLEQPGPTTAANQGNQPNQGSEASASSTAQASSSRRTAAAQGKGAPPTQPTTAAYSQEHQNLPPAAPDEPPTAAETTLRALGVYPSVARHYRALSPALIERAVAIAERLPRRSSLPATLVHLLREELTSPGWLRQERPDLCLGPLPELTLNGTGAAATCATTAYRLLCDALSAQAAAALAPDQIAVDAGTLLVELPASIAAAHEREVQEALEQVASRLGYTATLYRPGRRGPLTPAALRPPHPAARAAADAPVAKFERPDWIDAVAWGKLHLMARSALAGSHWEGETLVGASPRISTLLRTQLARLVAQLRNPGGPAGLASAH